MPKLTTTRQRDPVAVKRQEEIERLRAALTAIVDQDQEYDDGIKGPTHDGYSAELARAALEPRPAPVPTEP